VLAVVVAVVVGPWCSVYRLWFVAKVILDRKSKCCEINCVQGSGALYLSNTP
jgi:hypothetical protein